MSPWIKLAVPVGLGLLAGGVNWMAMQPKVPPRLFAVASQDIRENQVFTDKHFEKVAVPGDLVEKLPRTAVAYAYRETLIGRHATRDLKKNDLVLWQDSAPPGWALATGPDEVALPISLENISNVPQLIRVGDWVQFVLTVPKPPKPSAEKSPPDKKDAVPRLKAALEPPEDPDLEYLGPFRVLSVGERVSRETTDPRKEGRSASDRVVMIAVGLYGPERRIDPNVQSLLAARAAEQGGKRRVVAVVLHPGRRPKLVPPAPQPPA